jgi:hypothetical protein
MSLGHEGPSTGYHAPNAGGYIGVKRQICIFVTPEFDLVNESGVSLFALINKEDIHLSMTVYGWGP